MRIVLLPLCLTLVLAPGCGKQDPADRGESSAHDSPGEGRAIIQPLRQATVEADQTYTARITTSSGTLTLALFADDAPYTVSNFIHLSTAGFYDSLTFHLVVPGFVAQTGDPAGDGQGGPGYVFDDEISGRSHVRGAVSMANAGEPNTNGSQFFICLADLPFLDGKHTVFGQVVEGGEILDRLEEGDLVERVEIIEEGSP